MSEHRNLGDIVVARLHDGHVLLGFGHANQSTWLNAQRAMFLYLWTIQFGQLGRLLCGMKLNWGRVVLGTVVDLGDQQLLWLPLQLGLHLLGQKVGEAVDLIVG